MQSSLTHQQILKLATCKGIEMVDTENIVRIQSISNYCKIYFNDGSTLVLAKVLKWFEDQLTNPEMQDENYCIQFVRIHRTHLINMHYVQGYIKGTGGKIVLRNAEKLNVAKRKKAFTLDALRKFGAVA